MSRVVVLGASGYVGARLAAVLPMHGHEVVAVTRTAGARAPQLETVICDATDPHALRRAVRHADYVVNCIATRPNDSVTIARSLASLLRDDCIGRLVQLSSLAVFGQTRGVLHELSRPVPALGHGYATAKLRIEQLMAADEAVRARCLVLRLGCVYGPCAPVWVDRLLRLIHAGRLGWLGQRGQGACPVIHVKDVATAVACAIATNATGTQHLLTPGRLSWNGYFQLLANLSGIKTLRPQGALSLAREVWLTAPMRHCFTSPGGMPMDAITPAMARLFRSTATLVSIRSSLMRPHDFTPIPAGAAEAVGAFLSRPMPARVSYPVSAASQNILTA